MATLDPQVTEQKATQRMDALHYFHYGQLVHHGAPTGEPRVLAKTSGIDDAFIDLVLETAMIPALADSVGAGWGVLRTKRGQPLVLARAEIGSAGQVTHQFIKMPTDSLRQLAGNFTALNDYILKPLPEYEMLGDALTPITLSDVDPTTEAQVDSLLDLMSNVRNNTRNIEPLLSAIVTGQPLTITHAPPDGAVRLGFVQGLLTLLPASTRLGITFLTHSMPEAAFKTQLRFTEATPPEEAIGKRDVIYHWETGDIIGDVPKNDYSRFVVGQMRLDPELVTRETDKLTSAAGWRFNSGDNLAQALDYASHRAKVDQSIQNSLPVEASSVAKILSDDPTLTDEQRLRYSRHLVNFSLALDDLQYVDAIMATMQQHKDLQDEVYRFLVKALDEGQSQVIFETMLRWQQDPFSPTGKRWQQLLGKAALAELDELVAEDDEDLIVEYLSDINRLGKQASPIVGRVIDRVQPFLERDPEISARVLLLAVRNLNDTKLLALLQSKRLMKALPRDIQRYLVLISQPGRPAPPGTLIRAVNALEPSVRQDALVAFVRQAYANRRIDLIDERGLAMFVDTVRKDVLSVDRDNLAAIAEAIQAQTLTKMKKPAPRLILELLLLSQHTASLKQALSMQASDIYGIDRRREFIHSVQEAFANTPLMPDEAQSVIEQLDMRGAGALVVLSAIMGALEGTDWHPDMMPLADRATHELGNDIRVLEAMHPGDVITLVKYMARRGDARRLRIAARVMGSCAAYDRSKIGLKATNRAYKMLYSNERTQDAALEVVRQFVREADERAAQHMIKFYGDRLGNDVSLSLHTSYDFSNVMARLDWLTYASALQVTVDILQHAVEAFDNPNARPNLGYMRLLVERIRRESDPSERRAFTKHLRQLAHAVVVLAERHQRRSSSNDRHYKAIVTGEKDPRSTLDAYRCAGGHLLSGHVHPLRIKESNPEYPLGEGDARQLFDNISLASMILHEATQARATTRDKWSHSEIVAEIESQTGALIGDHEERLRQMGRNWQRLADLITYIASSSDSDVIKADNAQGRRLESLQIAPENVLDLFRFIYGYFDRQAAS